MALWDIAKTGLGAVTGILGLGIGRGIKFPSREEITAGALGVALGAAALSVGMLAAQVMVPFYSQQLVQQYPHPVKSLVKVISEEVV